MSVQLHLSQSGKNIDLRVFRNRVLRRIFGSKTQEVVGGWRILHNEDLHNLYISLHIIRVIQSNRVKWAEDVVCLGEMKNVYKIFVRKHKGRRPHRSQRHRWEGNIRLGYNEIAWEAVNRFIWLRIGTSGRPL
jgi:hypothetical protein